MKTLLRTLTILWVFCFTGCQHQATTSVQQTSLPKDLSPRYSQKDLIGVWEVVHYFSNSGAKGPAKPNLKYCFSEDRAYTGVPPEVSHDGAEANSSYFLVKDYIIIEGGLGVTPAVLSIRDLQKDTLVLAEDHWGSITLRRIRKTWDGGPTPVLKPKQIPLSGRPVP